MAEPRPAAHEIRSARDRVRARAAPRRRSAWSIVPVGDVEDLHRGQLQVRRLRQHRGGLGHLAEAAREIEGAFDIVFTRIPPLPSRLSRLRGSMTTGRAGHDGTVPGVSSNRRDTVDPAQPLSRCRGHAPVSRRCLAGEALSTPHRTSTGGNTPHPAKSASSRALSAGPRTPTSRSSRVACPRWVMGRFACATPSCRSTPTCAGG